MQFGRRKLLTVSVAAFAAPLCAPHVARAATKKLRAGHNNATTSSLHGAMIAFQKYVVEKTEGRYELDVYPAAQLGNDSQMVKAVADGTLDLTICATAILGLHGRDLELAETPFLFSDAASARRAMDGKLGAHYAELLAKGSLAAIGWGENGFRHVTANRPIRALADMKGLKIRVQAAKLQVEAFKGFGAEPLPMTFNEMPEALRTGRIDAQENPITIITSNEFIVKSQSHLALTGHVYSPFAILFSADVLEEMPAADRAVIQAAGAVAAKFTRDFNDQNTSPGIEKLKAAGMTVVADVDRKSFQAAMDSMGDRLASVAGGADALARVRGLIA